MKRLAFLAVLSLSALAAGLLMSCSDRSPTDPRSATQTTAEAASTATASTAPASTAPASTATAATAPTTAATTESTATSGPAAIEKPTYEAVFVALTRCTWTTLNPDPARQRFGGEEYITSEYNSDGTFLVQMHTDYNPSPTWKGHWNLAYGPPGAWYICRDDGERDEVLLLADGKIKFRQGLPVFPDKPLPAAAAAVELPPVQLPPAVLARIDRLTAHTWKRANDLDLNWYPTSVTFTKDFGYVSTYQGVPAPNRGGWCATLKKIQGLSPTSPIAGQARYGEQIDVDLLDDGNVLIGGELYVPKETPVTRGTIWAVFGYSDYVRVHVEYDMPVRKGVPCRFDVTITNLTSNRQDVTLQRFSVTREFSHEYRNYADKTLDIGKAKELAALDLGQVVLLRGQSKSYSLMVTFPESGSQQYYLNAMVLGTTQAWDNRHIYTFDIHD